MTFVAYKMVASEQTVSIYANVIAAIFILPYFLFSAFAGLLADKFDRSRLTRILKTTELILMIGAGILFVSKSLYLLIFILFNLLFLLFFRQPEIIGKIVRETQNDEIF